MRGWSFKRRSKGEAGLGSLRRYEGKAHVNQRRVAHLGKGRHGAEEASGVGNDAWRVADALISLCGLPLGVVRLDQPWDATSS